ncbi:MAG: DUF4976 domain-containing protein, partial [Lentisphaeraceae bacterium]|nr:DUF4976 domain-containing protein [Lentisphaeraceae bacterium]
TAIEEVFKVPLIISSPGGKAQRTEQIVELIDLFPTLCSLSEINAPKSVQGKDLKPALKNSNYEFHKKYAYSLSKDIHTLRTERYRIIKHKNKYELYDLKEDPNQKINLVQKSIFPEIQKLLSEAMTMDE